jgi:thiamine-monophosphate kinase
MGGIPLYALINLALPPSTEDIDVFQLYEGIIECAKAHRTAIVGGNISRSTAVEITITIIGESPDGKILKRSAAKTGDAIAVTGWPGSAAGGLAMLLQNLTFGPEAQEYFRHAFLHPIPRIQEGAILGKNSIAAAIDTSDGLLADLRHICEASKVSARLYTADLPIHDYLKNNFPDQALEMALTGGEDYQLLFTGKPETVKKAIKQLDIPVHIIGEITGGEPGNIEVLDAAGKPLKLKKTGWTHF